MAYVCDNDIHDYFNFSNPNSFQLLEMDRGSETQIQMTQNVNFLAQSSEGETSCLMSKWGGKVLCKYYTTMSDLFNLNLHWQIF